MNATEAQPASKASAPQRVVRIGGASGFWGDSCVGAPQLLAAGVDFLVFDYLAELTLSILAAARSKNPALGYATDFVEVTMRPLLRELLARGTRVVSNAGGLNPQACAQALAACAAQQGLALRIAVVEGDDVLHLVPSLRAAGVRELQSEAPLPDTLLTANAYLGALPIRQALDAGAQVVITGRCVDSAVTLGVLMHCHGWGAQDYDLLAQGSLAGHIIECGCQATGGLHTDWESVPDWPHIGYPIVECAADGSFTVTKPEGTGGLVNCAVVAEQLVYEIGDPRRYLLPDVTCDFSHVTLAQAGAHRVQVQGARGLAPGPHYKVSATWVDGFRCTGQLTIVGIDAVRKAERTAAAILTRTRELFRAQGWPDYSRTHIEVLGACRTWGVDSENRPQQGQFAPTLQPHSGPMGQEGGEKWAAAVDLQPTIAKSDRLLSSEVANFGTQARGTDAREVVLHLTVAHPLKEALALFAREIAPAGTSWAPGTTGAGGRPSPSPCIRQYAFLLDKARVPVRVHLGELAQDVAVPCHQQPVPAPEADTADGGLGTLVQASSSAADAQIQTVTVPLIALAWARSGDKGDTSNIGVIARRPEYLPWIRAALTEQAVAQWLGHLVQGSVTRYELPGICALNLVCTQALGGGGMTSLRNDPLGKGMAQILLTMPVQVPRAWAQDCQ